MSAADYARMSTDELLRDFIDSAKFLGSYWSSPPPARTPERRATELTISAISLELTARRPIEQLRQVLFDHESPEVRGWAGGRLLSTDPEWASAAFSGLFVNLSTREILALRVHARQGPPPHPALQDMSTDQLVARFEDAGIREYATRFLGDGDEPWDIELCNQIIDETSALVRELKTRNGLASLLPFLDHSNITVRRKAATHCLALAPERAAHVLKAVVATKDSFELGPASRALEGWPRGELK